MSHFNSDTDSTWFAEEREQLRENLYDAVQEDDMARVANLLYIGVKPSWDKEAPFRWCVTYNKPEMLELLLRYYEPQQFDILNLASIYGYTEIIRLMIDRPTNRPTHGHSVLQDLYPKRFVDGSDTS
jgi:hypothetical protein